MHKPLSLRKNFSWMFAGNIISAGCQWVMLMVMAKLLPEKEVGYYVLALAIATPVVNFSMLQLRLVQVTDVQNQYRFSDYLGVRLLTNLIAVLCLVGILLGLKASYSIGVYVVMFIVLSSKLIDSTSDICYGLMQKYERLDKVSMSLVFRSLGGAALLSSVLYITRNLIYGVLVMGLWYLLILLLFDRRNTERFVRFTPRFHVKNMFSIIWIGLPLGVVMGFIALHNSIPRYFIEANLGTEKLAVFGAMAYVGTGASRAVISLGYSVSARLAKYFVENRQAYVLLLVKVLAVTLVMSLAAVLFSVFFGREFLTLVYKKEYAQQPDVFVWLLIAAGGNMITAMLTYGMFAARRFRSQVPLHLVSMMVLLAGCWFFVPKYGMKGAAWSMLLAVACKIVSSFAIIALALRTPLNIIGQTASSFSEPTISE
jgi:O-antigen/teichoic acid export membrane protein